MTRSEDFSAADEQQIRDLLAAAPTPQMPPEVRARITAALANEPLPTARTAAGAGVPSARTRRSWLPVAAAAALVLLVGALVVPTLRTGPTPAAPAAAPSLTPPARPTADCPDGPTVYDSGTRYQQAALTAQAQALVPAGCRTDTDPTAEPVALATMPPQEARRSIECVVRAARSAQVLVIDHGFYDDRPAVMAVVAPPQRALAIACRKDTSRVLVDVPLR